MAKLVSQIPTLTQKAIVAAKPKLAVFLEYAKVELAPPAPTDIPQIIRGFSDLKNGIKNRTWRQMTVKEAWLKTCIGLEIAGCFFIGECIGKRGLIGYQV